MKEKQGTNKVKSLQNCLSREICNPSVTGNVEIQELVLSSIIIPYRGRCSKENTAACKVSIVGTNLSGISAGKGQ